MRLAYMDDLAIIIDDKAQVEDVLNRVVAMTNRLGVKFNAGKCGIANYKGTIQIAEEAVPIITEERAYKYLRTEMLPSETKGLDDCFKKT